MNPFLQDQLERLCDSLVTFVFCFPFDVDEFFKEYDPFAEEKAAAKKAEEERLKAEEEAKKQKEAEDKKEKEVKEDKEDVIEKYEEGSQSRQFLINLRKIKSSSET